MSNPNQSYKKAAILLVAIAAIVALMSIKIDTSGINRVIASMSSGTNLTRKDMAPAYSDSQKVVIKKRFTGFWKFNGPISDNISFDDRIEYKDNGIVWRYTKWIVRLPSGDSAEVAQVTQAYANPYAPLASDTTTVICESKVLKQVDIRESDTCYSTIFPDELWTIAHKDSSLYLGGRKYWSYKDSSLAVFFPAGAIHLPDDVRVREATGDYPVIDWFRKDIADDCGKIKGGADSTRIMSILSDWYVPLCLRQAFVSQAGGPTIADTVRLAFELTVNHDGTVKNVSVSGNSMNSIMFQRILKNEVNAWRFPETVLDRTLKLKFDSKPNNTGEKVTCLKH